MENFEAQFCRLCLHSISGLNYRVIDDVTRQDLDVLLKLNFDDAHKQIICNSCSEKLNAAVKFKSTCLDADRVILPYINCGHPVPVDLKEIYLKETGITELDDEEICRLCMQPVKKQFMSVYAVDNNVLQKYIPEVNFGATASPIICKPCLDSLVVHSSFIKDCLEVEEKVKKFFGGETVASPMNVSNLALRIKNEEIKEETYNEVIFKSEMNLDTVEETDIKVELVTIEETAIKTENVDEETLLSSQDVKEEPELNKHTISHKDESEIQLYECEWCNIKYKHKQSLNHHMLIHKNDKTQWHQCHICEYKSVFKEYLKRHMLIHKNLSEVQQYPCGVCDFKSKHKNTLRRHMKVHKEALDLQWYACEVCDCLFKYKSSLNKHSLKHMPVQSDASEAQYECETCHCKFKNKNNLGEHMVIHKDASEIQWFECDICGYKAKRKKNLNGHMLTHKHASEILWYECHVCDYKSKYKSGLNGHMIIHKDSSEIRWFKCEICDYKSKYKYHLNKHLRIHNRVASESQ